MTKSLTAALVQSLFPRGLTHFLSLSGVWGFGNSFPRAHAVQSQTLSKLLKHCYHWGARNLEFNLILPQVALPHHTDNCTPSECSFKCTKTPSKPSQLHFTHLLSFFPACSCRETWCPLVSTAPGLCCCMSGPLQGSRAVLGHLKKGKREGWKRRRVKKNKLGECMLACRNT